MLRTAGRFIALAMLVIGLCGLQTACGQKGKLYLPDKTTERSGD